jgi:serine/threonine-protein kinase ATR
MSSSRSLTSFLRNDIPEAVLLKNRRETVKFLRTLSEREGLGEQETLILAWGQVAR